MHGTKDHVAYGGKAKCGTYSKHGHMVDVCS